MSIILSAFSLKEESLFFSMWIAFSIDPSSGWGLRVSLNLLRSTSFSASRKRISVLYLSLRFFKTSLISDKNPFSLMSIPMPILLISLFRDMMERKDLMSAIGRLSTQKKPESSRALNATVLPEPDSPVIITMIGALFFSYCFSVLIHGYQFLL